MFGVVHYKYIHHELFAFFNALPIVETVKGSNDTKHTRIK